MYVFYSFSPIVIFCDTGQIKKYMVFIQYTTHFILMITINTFLSINIILEKRCLKIFGII